MKKRLLALLLLTGLLSAALTGCGGGSTEQASGDGQTADGSAGARAQTNEIVVGIAQDLDESLDPHRAVAAGTKEVMFNVFEGLVKPTPDGDLIPAVASGYTVSPDQTVYTFTLREGVLFHNGDPVEMEDVVYSIERCADDSEGTPLIPALSAISDIQSDETTLTITLAQPDSEFLSYLTLAVLPADYDGQDTAPVGTGPYMYVEGADSVEAFSGYGASLPVERIYLKEYTGAESIITAFEDSYIDLVTNDASAASNLGYGGNTETRWYNTLNMHYIGFNMSSELMSNPTMRTAISLALDREAAAGLMRDAAVPASLPVSPVSPYYDESIAASADYNLQLCAQVLTNAGLSDMDNDGLREYVSYSVMHDVELDIIVCSESAGKGDICKLLADSLGTLGVKVNVRELSWSDYIAELRDYDADGKPDGDFDMYYAEVKLGADFDLSPLLTENGSLNYGKIADENYAAYIDAFLAATDLDRSSKCAELLRYIVSTAPIVPVCFERHEVITHRNVITGIEVTANNIFYNIPEWKITFGEVEKGA